MGATSELVLLLVLYKGSYRDFALQDKLGRFLNEVPPAAIQRCVQRCVVGHASVRIPPRWPSG